VSELDEAWALALVEAEVRARAAGRKDITEYLALRSANDLTRKIASDWLLGMFVTVAGEANRAGAAIKLSTEDAHRFKVGHANMVGSRLSLVSGVRLLSVEAGWPRAPRDGFIRGGGLACGNIKHRGMKSANQELRLILSANGTPSWIIEGKRASHPYLHEEDIKNHIALLLDDSRNRSTRS
jgi:hypothetical protein